jgi:hypothetical protein
MASVGNENGEGAGGSYRNAVAIDEEPGGPDPHELRAHRDHRSQLPVQALEPTSAAEMVVRIVRDDE